jgi:TRAP-type C4-dicarboxylate transport system permease small subunit
MSGLSRAASAFSACCLVAMTVVVSWQVFARYMLGKAPAWSEETAQILTLYFALFGATFAYREGLHIGIEVLNKRLRRNWAVMHKIVLDLLVATFGAYMVIWGLKLALATWDQTMPATQMPTGVSYLPLPCCGALLVCFAGEKLATAFACGVKRKDAPDG